MIHRLPTWSIFLFALSHVASQVHATSSGQADATDFFENHPQEIDVEQRGDEILFANRQIGLAFRKSDRGFQLTRIYGIERNQDFLTEVDSGGFRDLFRIRMTLDPHHVQRDERHLIKYGHFNILDQMAGDDPFIIGSNEASDVSWRHEERGPESILHLEWSNIDAREDKAVMDVAVTVRLRAGDPLSYWRIHVLNRSAYGTGRRHYPRLTRYGIDHVRFPLLSLAPIEHADENVFLYPKYRGELFRKPFQRHHSSVFYPNNFNMQFQALYNRRSRSGLYLGTFDPAASFMMFDIKHEESKIDWQPGHFPPNITFTGEDFDLPYDYVIGPFAGDWYDAAQIYRRWAVRQPWCRKGKLSQRRDIPDWYRHAPLILYTDLGDSAAGTFSREENLLVAERHFMEFLDWSGVRLAANYYDLYQWAGRTAYDLPVSIYRSPRPGRFAGGSTENSGGGNYPKIPMIPGFSASCARLRAAGGMVCPYYGLELFDTGPAFDTPYAAESIPHLVRGLYGAMRRWGTETALQPCVVTDWWRQRSKESCVLMLQRENVGGFYLDVMQGCSLPCYWTPHGHTAAGGDSMTRGMHELVQILTDAVRAEDSEAITTGENPSENMIDVTDGFLQVTLGPMNTAPIFATVYQDYALRYGLEVSLDPDAFFIQCASLFVEGMQIGRLRLRPRSNSLSFQNPDHRQHFAFLKRVIGYYQQPQARKFLVYGQLLRPLTFKEPVDMPILGDRTHGGFTALMSGVFRSEDGELGIFVANAGKTDLDFAAALDLARYGIVTGTAIRTHRIAPDGSSQPEANEGTGVINLSGSLPARHITMFHIQPEDRQ